MFAKMRKRIFNSVFYVVLAFVLLISGVSFGVTANNLTQTQRQRAQANAENGVKGAETYLSAVMGFVEQTSRLKGVVDAVSGADVSGASRALDGLCGYAVKIDGAMLYGESFNGCFAVQSNGQTNDGRYYVSIALLISTPLQFARAFRLSVFAKKINFYL